MSRADERIPVPTNGHRPPLEPEPGDADDVADQANPVDSHTGLGFQASPAQLAVGFGIVASLILLVFGARRRRRR